MTDTSDWRNDIEKLERKEVEEYKKALDTLLSWKFFKEAYEGYGLNVVNAMLENSIAIRAGKGREPLGE